MVWSSHVIIMFFIFKGRLHKENTFLGGRGINIIHLRNYEWLQRTLMTSQSMALKAQLYRKRASIQGFIQLVIRKWIAQNPPQKTFADFLISWSAKRAWHKKNVTWTKKKCAHRLNNFRVWRISVWSLVIAARCARLSSQKAGLKTKVDAEPFGSPARRRKLSP